MLPALSVILGGAASGKSVFAEKLLKSSKLNKVYIATAQIFDVEMQLRVDRHLMQRGQGWTTIEAPLDLQTPLSKISFGDVVLLDCATLWLSNVILAERDLRKAQAGLLSALSCCAAPVVVVTNEVGQGIVPENALAREFREAQGRLNIALAAQADLVVQIVAGLPNVLKGELP